MNTRLPSTEPRTQSSTEQQRLSAISLDDHLAGAGRGVSVIPRMARAHRNRPAARTSAVLAAEIAEDRESPRELMTALGVTEQWPRVAVGRLAQKAGLRVRAARRTFTATTTLGALGSSARSRRSLQERAGWTS